VNPKLNTNKSKHYEFDLFLAGRTFYSEQIVRKFHRHARRFLKSRYRLNVIDVLESPELARQDLVLATPTLVKRKPAPVVRVVGVPSDWEKFFANMQANVSIECNQLGTAPENCTPPAATAAGQGSVPGDPFRSLIAAIGDGVLVLDSSGRILFANQAAERLMRRPAAALKGLHFGSPVLRNGKLEIDLIGDTPPFPVAELNVTCTHWDGATAYVAVMRDITSHKFATELARERVLVRDNFLATLSHEMRNPLAAMSNAAQIVSRTDSLNSQMLEEAAAVLVRQCTQMSRLLDDLLEVSRISQGKIELQRKNVPVSTLISDAASAIAPLMESRGLTFHIQPTSKSMLVHVDAVRLQQAIGNLLTNAAKYTEPGGEVWLSTCEEHGHVDIVVRDNGTGIPPDLAKRMFEPFVQGEHNSGGADGGLGIGLALVRTLVELHDGEVWASSQGPGLGSAFTINLPLAADGQVSHETPVASEVSKTLRIVLVEDNHDVRSMLKSLLELDGHEVSVAENGQEGLETILAVQPDLALVDLGLPLLDGREVAKKVRENPLADDVYLVALTGFGNADDRRSTRAAGFDAHLTKPVNIPKLNRLLQSRVALREPTT